MISPTTTVSHQNKNQSVHFWQQCLVIARVELQLHFRSFLFWTTLIIIILTSLLLSWLTVNMRSGAFHSSISAQSYIADIAAYQIYNIALPVHVLLPFLLSGTFSRDIRQRTTNMIWLRPLSPFTYMAGKGLACTLIALLIGYAALGIAIVYQMFMQFLLPLDALPYLFLLYTSSLLLITWLSLLCTCFLPRPLLGSLLVTGLVIYVDFFAHDTLRELYLLTVQWLFYYPSIALGQDGLLLTYRIAFIFLLACTLSTLCLLIAQWRFRIGNVLRHQVVSTLLLTIIGAGTLLSVFLSFQQILPLSQRATVTVPPQLQATTEDYKLNVSVDPSNGYIKGDATFQLTPQQTGDTQLPIELNPGLTIQTITVNDQVTDFRSTEQWTFITLHQADEHQSFQITIQYVGNTRIAREDYASSNSPFSSTPLNLSYAGQEFAFLQGRGGSWYPLPWTDQNFQQQLKPVMAAIRLQFPASYHAISSLGMFTRQGQVQELFIQPHSILPDAFATALAQPHQEKMAPDITILNKRAFDPAQIEQYELISDYLHGINQWQSPQHWQVIMVPFLKIPVLGSGLLFYPESPTELLSSSWTKAAVYRSTGQIIIQAWLTNMFPITPIRLSRSDSVTLPYPAQYPSSWNILYNLLTEYLSAKVVNQHIEPQFLQNEARFCEKNRIEESPDNSMSIMFGNTRCEASPVLYPLEQEIGEEEFNRFLQEFSANHYGQFPSIKQFVTEIQQQFEKDITHDVVTYYCQGMTISEEDPLSCLDV